MSEGDKITQSFILNAIPDTLAHSKPCGLTIGKCNYAVRAWKDVLRETCTHLYSRRQATFLKYRNALVPNSIGRIWIKKKPSSFTSPFIPTDGLRLHRHALNWGCHDPAHLLCGLETSLTLALRCCP